MRTPKARRHSTRHKRRAKQREREQAIRAAGQERYRALLGSISPGHLPFAWERM